jgi:hypothetical protein
LKSLCDKPHIPPESPEIALHPLPATPQQPSKFWIMKKILTLAILGLFPVFVFAQVGHIMQGIGAHNMSMGGAATGQPLDINGALNWNPAGISAFNSKVFSFNAGLFFSAPELSSTVPTPNGMGKERQQTHMGSFCFRYQWFWRNLPRKHEQPNQYATGKWWFRPN